LSVYPRSHRRASSRRAGGRWRAARYLCGAFAVVFAVTGLGIILRAPADRWCLAIVLESAASLFLLGVVVADHMAEKAQAPVAAVLRSVPVLYGVDEAPTTPLDRR